MVRPPVRLIIHLLKVVDCSPYRRTNYALSLTCVIFWKYCIYIILFHVASRLNIFDEIKACISSCYYL